MVNALPQILRAEAYQPGKPIEELAREIGISPERIIKLASNENPLGMSPQARQAAVDAMHDSALYPDGNGFHLKQALCEHLKVEENNLTLGAGSNEILDLVASVFLSAGTSAVYSQYSFAVYAQATLRVAADGISVPAKDYGHDLDAMLKAIRDDTRVVFVANPNNPTGTFIDEKPLLDFLSKVPASVLVVLDEAYYEYLPAARQYNTVDWIKQFPNLIVARTFSKAYGLAGLRVGYSISHPDIADYLNRIRSPFNVSTVAQAAAVAALADVDFCNATREVNLAGLQQFSTGLGALGIRTLPSCGNFILAEFGETAGAVNAYLLKNGVIVRPMGRYGLKHWLRISVGLPEQNRRLLDLLDLADSPLRGQQSR
ncbi:histidinol-phosphate transaminase [Paraburkholderia sp. D15]|uniref:histidinol-phosphate transaminase n=1 Tax=Paraburkholderia sp. D15 TaxID=2880218 RepID=UPI0024786C71|nr:histidinol-phosphate transaminase [Paraburkholderia sp. D15]WGS54686.1 histidinol-phosphate transaminase [Paraburkholderia sp. D15]